MKICLPKFDSLLLQTLTILGIERNFSTLIKVKKVKISEWYECIAYRVKTPAFAKFTLWEGDLTEIRSIRLVS